MTLVIQKVSSTVDTEGAVITTITAVGSSVWTIDTEGNYHFNVKTSKTAPWSTGTYLTTVSYAGITLASTYFVMAK